MVVITSDIFYARYVWNGSRLKPECYEYMDSYRLISTSNLNTEMFVFPSFLWAAFYFEDTHASHICRSHGPDVSGGLPLAVTTLAGRYWGSTRDNHPQRFLNHCTLVRMMYSGSFIPCGHDFESTIWKLLKVVLEHLEFTVHLYYTFVQIIIRNHQKMLGFRIGVTGASIQILGLKLGFKFT